jgi:XTP/dITP diphosphohydrolase
MQVLFATSNPHKVREVREVLCPLGIDILILEDLSEAVAEPVEDGATFAENARIKAIGYARATGHRCLAEDSGLEVDALGGAPGVHSARYAEVEGNREEKDRANNNKLLRELSAIPSSERTARFVCAMCLADSNGTVIAETRGTYDGVIADSPRGTNGFGYDPLLFLPDVEKTSAELSSDEKNARSHRGAAARQMALVLKQLI